MDTTRTILCECCSDTAHTFDTYSESVVSLDGLTKACDTCGVLGRVSVDCDEDGVYARFYTLTESECMMLENHTLLEAYLKNQEIIDKLMHQVSLLTTVG